MEFFDLPESAFDWAPDARVEGIAKVTGRGKYSAEYAPARLCHAVLVGATVPAGRITAIDVEQAKSVAGVLAVLSHLDRPTVPALADEAKLKAARFGLPIFHTDQVYFHGQPIALVVAETLEDAVYAASLVQAAYAKTPFEVDFHAARAKAELKPDGTERGQMDAWPSAAAHHVDREYTIDHEVHNPMEMHATIAEWLGPDSLRLYDKNQGVNRVQQVFATLFEIPAEKVEVISEFVGGGFGSGLRVWPHAVAAAMAARRVERPVKLVLTRPQMFNLVGYRPASWQRFHLGADATGKFLGIHHQASHSTSVYESFNEGITRVTRLIYDVPNLKAEASTVPLNLGTPTWMRGPGDCTGDFAIESSIDELSYTLGIDPVELRLKNLALEKHPDNGLPWSTNFVDECMLKGAEMIGWQARKPGIRQTADGPWLLGYGMAIGMWGAGRQKQSAGIVLRPDGSITVQTAMTDIGTGTGTAMQNMAAKQLGLDKQFISVELGNSNLPPAPSQGGSTGLSSLSGAVSAACEALQQRLLDYAKVLEPSYAVLKAGDVQLTAAGISAQSGTAPALSYARLWAEHKLDIIKVEASSGPGEERQKWAFCSAAAHFYQVSVHTLTGKVKVDRAVCVADGGTIINELAAANQISGAVVGGIGMTLMEKMDVDTKLGCLVGNDFAGYHCAVNADTPIIEVAFIGKSDPNINPTGSKGLGEVGIIGSAAAIANAIYHATGKRLRDLPITPDRVLLAYAEA